MTAPDTVVLRVTFDRAPRDPERVARRLAEEFSRVLADRDFAVGGVARVVDVQTELPVVEPYEWRIA